MQLFSFYFCFRVIVVLLIFMRLMLFLVAASSLSLPFFYVVFEYSYLPYGWVLFSSFSRQIVYLCLLLCIVINSLVFCFICWSSSLVHFKNGPKYLIKETAKVFIPLMRVLQLSLVSRSFSVRLRHSFLISFPFISVCLTVSAYNISKYLYIFFSQSVLILLYFVVLFLPLFVFSRFSLLAWYIFSILNSITIF